MKAVPFMSIPGSEPNAVMKGDKSQHVGHSTAPGTKPKKPKVVRQGGGQFSLPKQRR